MRYQARYIMVVCIFASLPICSMEIDRKTEEVVQIGTNGSTIPSLLTLCLKKIDLLSKDKQFHNDILTKLPTDIQEILHNHLREKFDPMIAQEFLNHTFIMPYTYEKFDIENAPSFTDEPQKNIYWKKQPYHIGFVAIYSKFNNELIHIREDRKHLSSDKQFYMQDNKFIQKTMMYPAREKKGAKYITDLSRFNFLVQKSLEIPLKDLLAMNTSSDNPLKSPTNKELIKKFFTKWQRQYNTFTKKQKTTNTTSSKRPTKKQKI